MDRLPGIPRVVFPAEPLSAPLGNDLGKVGAAQRRAVTGQQGGCLTLPGAPESQVHPLQGSHRPWPGFLWVSSREPVPTRAGNGARRDCGVSRRDPGTGRPVLWGHHSGTTGHMAALGREGQAGLWGGWPAGRGWVWAVGAAPSLEQALGLWGRLGRGLQLLCRPAGATDVCEPDGMGLSASGIWTRGCTSEGEWLVC